MSIAGDEVQQLDRDAFVAADNHLRLGLGTALHAAASNLARTAISASVAFAIGPIFAPVARYAFNAICRVHGRAPVSNWLA